jgi:2-C-methyl-D-erythritol 2,4-cyclodiphosphate synthase
MRIGFGYDVHRLEEGRRLVLGGVDIPAEEGCVAHSDGDVLIHAICDSLLGAANLGDIGQHFPNTSAEYKDISSVKLLERSMRLIEAEGYSVVNMDATLCLEKPKLAPYIQEMKKILVPILKTPGVSIKATTTEKLGFTGRGEGVSAYAVVLIDG